MDKITFKGMQFYAYHGVFPEENSLGQLYKVDLEVYLDLRPAGQTDQLAATINYAELYAQVKQVMEGSNYQLIEGLAEAIASKLLAIFPPIEEIVVQVIKPTPPIAGHFDYVAVEIRRARQ